MSSETKRCAACGKSGENLKKCSACNGMAVYCGAACQRAHWPRHKEECKRYQRWKIADDAISTSWAASLFDQELFRPPPRREDDECPICFLPMIDPEGKVRQYVNCCGKVICQGCVYEHVFVQDNDTCPFCREPRPASDKDVVLRLRKRMGMNDAHAFFEFGKEHMTGNTYLPRAKGEDIVKFFEQGAEKGSGKACQYLGHAYDGTLSGLRIKIDQKKALHYYQRAAMGGELSARYNLGVMEYELGNKGQPRNPVEFAKIVTACKHWLIAAKQGCPNSMKMITGLYPHHFVPKSEFEQALRAHGEARAQCKSESRTKASKYFKTEDEQKQREFESSWAGRNNDNAGL